MWGRKSRARHRAHGHGVGDLLPSPRISKREFVVIVLFAVTGIAVLRLCLQAAERAATTPEHEFVDEEAIDPFPPLQDDGR